MSGALLARPALAARVALAWWIAELVALAPPSLLRLFGMGDRSANVLEFGADHAVLVLAGGGRARPMQLPLAGMAETERRERVRAAIRRHGRGEGVAVRLDPALVFQTSLNLPFSAQRNLRAIIRHQIERLVPIDASDTCFDCRAAPRAPGARTLEVELVVAKLAAVEEALALARGLGLRPTRVLAPQSGPTAALVLWEQSSAIGTGRGRSLRHGLEIASVALLLIAYGLHVHRLDRIRDDLRARVVRAEQAANAARDLGRSVARTQAALAFLDRRRDSVPPLRILDALTRLVPLDSWVTRLELRGNRIEIAGYAPRATDLIARIERSALFEKPEFRSPITLAPDGRVEQFDLSFATRAGAGR
jgi:general secretion pathway protein L